MSYRDKVIFVTGAGSGIGRSVALEAAKRGAKLVCVEIDERSLAETVELIESEDGECLAVPCNVVERESIVSAIAQCESKFGSLDALFNVAGIGGLQHTEKVREEEWNRIIGVNLTGTFFASQAALPLLLAQKKSAIVNVASVAGMNGQAYSAAYCASKFGVVGLTKALAVEYVKKGLRVNCVCPAGVKTPLMGKFLPPEDFDGELMARFGLVKKFTHPEEVANSMLFLASEEARSINGVALAMDFGNSAT